MIRDVLGAFVLSAAVVAGSSVAQACTLPNNLTNGTNADATQVMANFNALLNCITTSHTRTVLTGGAGTYTPPVGVTALNVRMVGGGAGGQGNSPGGVNVTSAGAGGATTFGSLTANGGPVDSVHNYPPVAGGTASGCDLNIQGGTGGGAGQLGGTTPGQMAGGNGAGTVFGTGGSSLILTSGTAGNAPGSGGGGAGASTTPNSVAGSGGAAGGYCEKLISSPAASYSYSIGAGGTAGGGVNYNGGAGAAGIIIIDEYY